MENSLDYLHECFKYEMDTGVLIWRERPPLHFATSRARNAWNKRFAGKEAGCVSTYSSGSRYVAVGINKKLHLAHRVIFFMVHGWLPKVIDHIDQDGLNNRAENLRAATYTINARNARMRSDNKSGFPGVNWHKRDLIWVASVRMDGKSYHLGYYENPEEASAAYQKAIKAAGFSPLHGSRREHGRLNSFAGRFNP